LMAVANVNGALVGGASLKAADFLGIAAGCP
jgi:triosephosphate isomerase